MRNRPTLLIRWIPICGLPSLLTVLEGPARGDRKRGRTIPVDVSHGDTAVPFDFGIQLTEQIH